MCHSADEEGYSEILQSQNEFALGGWMVESTRDDDYDYDERVRGELAREEEEDEESAPLIPTG